MEMITKNIQLPGKDLVDKFTGDPYTKKEAGTGLSTTYSDDLKLLHQLQVLQVEMEMEQEQKYLNEVSLEEINRKESELFEFSPNGYFALTAEGLIREVNLTGAGILGRTMNELTNQLFINYIAIDDREAFHVGWYNLINSRESQVFKASMIKADGQKIYARIALSGTWIEDEFFVLLAMTDVTIWKQVEEVIAFLLDCNWSASGKDFFQSLTEYLGKSLRMDYVGIDKLINDKEAEVISAFHEIEVELHKRYQLTDRAFSHLLDRKSFCYPNGAYHLFLNDSLLQQLKAESFAGATLWGSEGKPIGLIVLAGRQPIMDIRVTDIILKQVSIRAVAELEHRQLEETIIASRSELELQIKSRTAELQDANKKLRHEIKIRQQQGQSLKEAEEKYRTVADYTYHWETWLSPGGEYIYVSPSCKRISGYTVEEFMQEPSLLIRITHPDDRQMVEEFFANAVKGIVPNGPFEFRIISRDGHERWISHHSQPVFDSKGLFMGQRGSNQDITQRKVAEKILLDSQKHLRQLSQRMEEITEAERTRIAREIHDELGHLLSALKYDMEGLVNHSNLLDEHLKGELELMVDMVDSLIDSVRRIATELRPGILDHLGLFPAIEWQLKQFRLRTKICCSFSVQEMEISFDKNETNIIFRILQEILTNITRHAEATHVEVRLSKTNSRFQMEVTDNGVGFEYDDVLQANTLGLIGMKERALSIGGEIEINSKPGKGTVVRFLLERSGDQ
ncbi:MAG: PAS domain S-box protein [Candidatus Saccharibacteria bacterium]